MGKVLVVDPEKCIRCRICELICSFTKRGEYNPKRALIRVVSNKDMNVNIPVLLTACDFCGKCVDHCPRKVLQFVELNEASLLRREIKMGRFPAPLISRLGLGG